ncbi:predicted protein [Arabidopsis lyrata subsp. lyrata]|uniref:Predicted protein n=1 Tax=Arabidopsis lyrata subsp. lyrata TaxID=81972 RepID=D7M3W5_ARALL|nr:predicted protein [Arabidopsis lyrata subsp. lyrata]
MNTSEIGENETNESTKKTVAKPQTLRYQIPSHPIKRRRARPPANISHGKYHLSSPSSDPKLKRPWKRPQHPQHREETPTTQKAKGSDESKPLTKPF